jgi:hypothetical protein
MCNFPSPLQLSLASTALAPVLQSQRLANAVAHLHVHPAVPTLLGDGVPCAHNASPTDAMPAHEAPLGISAIAN